MILGYAMNTALSLLICQMEDTTPSEHLRQFVSSL